MSDNAFGTIVGVALAVAIIVVINHGPDWLDMWRARRARRALKAVTFDLCGHPVKSIDRVVLDGEDVTDRVVITKNDATGCVISLKPKD